MATIWLGATLKRHFNILLRGPNTTFTASRDFPKYDHPEINDKGFIDTDNYKRGSIMDINFGLLFGHDKWQHLSFYTSVSLVLGLTTLLLSAKRNQIRNISIIWVTLMVIGIIEEYRQLLLPDRSAELLDALYNMLGITIGLVIPTFIFSKFSKVQPFPLKRLTYFIIILSPFLLGLLYFNEEPFITFNGSLSDRVRNLLAMINFQ